MDNQLKLKKIQQIISFLGERAHEKFSMCQYNDALCYISSSAQIQYAVNQNYTDEALEELLSDIASKITFVPADYCGDLNTVLFYDGFGLDLRGLAITYTIAIAKSGFHLVYVIPENSKKNIPHIIAELASYNVDIIELEGKKHIEKIKNLNYIFNKYRPNTAFFYTVPDDVTAVTVFDSFKGKVTRYQIDLTDHAFWLGTKAVDYIMESREMGASLAIYERGFTESQIRRLDALTYINNEICTDVLPFDIEKEKYFFSGGALYKTLGDKELFFYKTIDHILNKYKNMKFLYAGYGDSSEIQKLEKKYPGRVYLISERPDFYRLIENCVFYLNSYPMFGGMMMRYAALANKLPMTLKHERDSDGILFNQEELGIEFADYHSFINEIELILNNDVYRREKEKGLLGSVLTEDVFNSNVKSLITDGKTEFFFNKIPIMDTTKFRNEYIERFKYPEDLHSAIFNRKNLNLIFRFPRLYILSRINKLKGKVGI